MLTLTEAGDEVITVADAKAHLRIDMSDEDDYLAALITAAHNELLPPSGWLGRALTTSTFRYSRRCWAPQIQIPAPPLQSVTSVNYIDPAGDLQTLSTDVYRVITDAEPGLIVLKQNQFWPLIANEPDAVQVTFVAGYGNAAAVPLLIKQYMLLMIGHWYQNREAVSHGSAMPTPFVRHMLDSFRVWGG